MHRILLLTEKSGEVTAWDTTTVVLRDKAYLQMFSYIDEHGGFQLIPIAGEQLRDMARRGNPDFARAFLELHRSVIPMSFQEIPVHPLRPSPADRPIRKVWAPEALEDRNLPAPLPARRPNEEVLAEDVRVE